MPTDDHLQRLLGHASDLADEPTADVPAIVARARRDQHRRRGLLAGAVGLVVLVFGVAVAALDDGPPERLSTVDAPRDERREEQRGAADPRAVDTTTTTDESRVSPTTTDAGASAAGDGDDAIPPPQAAPGPLRLTVSASTVASYAPVAVRSTDPCPPGTQWVEVDIQAVGGSMDGQGVGGDQLRPDAAGHWSVDAGIAAVGRIEDVAWAMTADQLDVRARCRDRDQRSLADYEPVRVRLASVPVVPALTATWDGTTVRIEYSGCPTSHQALVSWGVEPPPPGISYPRPYAAGPARPGSQPGTWFATIEVPDHPASDGLWATAFCEEPSGVTSIWRYLPVELDPPD